MGFRAEDFDNYKLYVIGNYKSRYDKYRVYSEMSHSIVRMDSIQLLELLQRQDEIRNQHIYGAIIGYGGYVSITDKKHDKDYIAVMEGKNGVIAYDKSGKQKRLTWARINSEDILANVADKHRYNVESRYCRGVYFAYPILDGDVGITDAMVKADENTVKKEKLLGVNSGCWLDSKGELVIGSLDGVKDVRIPYGTKTIPSGAFKGSGIEKVVIPDTVKRIGESAFSECRNLTQVEIPGSVSVIGVSAFEYCSLLQAVRLHYGLKQICSRAFHVTMLRDIYIPSSIETIGCKSDVATVFDNECSVHIDYRNIDKFAYSRRKGYMNCRIMKYKLRDGLEL